MKSRTCFISITTFLRPVYPFMGVLILHTCHHASLTKKITLQFSYICSRTSHLFFWAIFRSSCVISLSTSNELNPGDTLHLHPAPPPQNIDMKTSFQFLSHKKTGRCGSLRSSTSPRFMTLSHEVGYCPPRILWLKRRPLPHDTVNLIPAQRQRNLRSTQRNKSHVTIRLCRNPEL